VQYRCRARRAHNRNMKKGLCRWLSTSSVYCIAVLFDFQEILGSQAAFIH
jgi:hypothetical protein